MDLNSIGFSGINKIGANNNIQRNKIVNFSGNDIVDFSEVAKVRNQTIKDLNDVGFTNDEANELIAKYSKTDEFKELTEKIEKDKNRIPGHRVELISGRNLTQAEAILYMEYPMDDYYLQHTDLGCLPRDYEESSSSAQDYEIGEANFLPTDLAKQIKKGFPIEVAGMILKGKISEEDAIRMQPFYDETSCDNYINNTNVQQSEYTIDQIVQNLDKAEAFLSEEKDEKGNLVSGFTRPLTHKESVALILEDYMPQDVDSINKFLELNKVYGYSIYDMSIEGLWGKTVEDLENERAAEAKKLEEHKANKPNIKKIETVKDAITILRYEYPYLSDENYDVFFEDLSQLDSEKFLKKLSFRQLKFDAVRSSASLSEIRLRNIKAMNTMSMELIDKITTKSDGRVGRFATLGNLLYARNLEEKVKNIEEVRMTSPQMFEKMSKDSVMDYLTSSSFYSSSSKTLEEFKGTIDLIKYGIPLPQKNNNATIIDFPKKNEE